MDSALPVFDPVPLPAAISDVEMLRARQLRPEHTEIAKAEALCLDGRVSAAECFLLQLLHKGEDRQRLRFCLLGAVLSRSEDLVRLLLDAGVPVSLGTVKSAIETKSVSILSLFLQHGWAINEEELWCLPPLLSHALATDADETLIAWFLSNGADPNARCQMDITPLSTAAGCAPVKTVKQLLDHCAGTTSFHGQLLHWAARRASSDADEVIELIFERCHPDVNGIMYENDVFSYEVRKIVGLGTALHEAARIGLSSVVQILLQKGADPSIRDSRGKTALEVAECHGNHAALDYLRHAQKDAMK